MLSHILLYLHSNSIEKGLLGYINSRKEGKAMRCSFFFSMHPQSHSSPFPLEKNKIKKWRIQVQRNLFITQIISCRLCGDISWTGTSSLSPFPMAADCIIGTTYWLPHSYQNILLPHPVCRHVTCSCNVSRSEGCHTQASAWEPWWAPVIVFVPLATRKASPSSWVPE